MATATSVSKEEILEAISAMSVMDIVDLVSAMEEKFGVSAAAVAVAPAGAAAGGGEAEAAEAQTAFDVHMTSFGESKINVIKAVRKFSGLGLKEAKEMVEGTPCVVKEGATQEEADAIKAQLEEAGATAELK